MLKLGIVADDLTGAVDTGVQFAKWGLQPLVMLASGELPPATMVVVSTDSRDVPAAEAYQRAQKAAQLLADRAIYKKIDSTLRGNLGSELDGVMEGLGIERALVAPAYPPAGRTTLDGFHRVDGVLLADSSFAHDPLWPATESHIPTLLARQTRHTVGHLPISVVERGEKAVIKALKADKAAVIVADAADSRHLRTLAQALAQMDQKWLPVGSAGLAEEWPLALGLERPRAVGIPWTADDRPVLVVSGSRHEATGHQLHRAVSEGRLTLVHLSSEGNWQPVVEARAVPLLQEGRSVALTTSFSSYAEGKGQAMSEMLAQAAVWALGRSSVSGLFMTGGDVARSVTRVLGVTALHALGEVQAGVPAGAFVGGQYDGLRIVTKAGGFGDERAISQSIDCMQGKQE